MRAAVAGFTLCGRVSARDTVAVETRASRATSASLAVLLDEPRFTGSRPGKNTGSSLATPVAACKRFHSGSIHAYCYTAHASLLSDPRETSKPQPGPVAARAPLYSVPAVRLRRPDLRIGLEPLSQALSGARGLRADPGPRDLHGRHGDRLVARSPLLAQLAQSPPRLRRHRSVDRGARAGLP